MGDETSINGVSVHVKRPASVLIPKQFDMLMIPPPPPNTKPSLNGSSHHYNNHSQLLHRRVTLSAPPSATTSTTTTTTASSEFDLPPFKSSRSISYTSLRDILPAAPAAALLSPPAVTVSSSSSSSAAPWSEISIRNRLVKQAAWAYLQPMSSSPSSSGRRLWSYFSGDFVRSVLQSVGEFLVDSAARLCNWLADALWLLLCR